jgi:uncharacterized membrane protein YgcG
MLRFEISEKVAKKRVRRYVGGLFGAPIFLTAGAVVNKYYVPSMLFDLKAAGNVTVGFKSLSYEAKRLNNLSVSYSCNTALTSEYRLIPIDMSRFLDDALMERMAPFDFEKLTDVKDTIIQCDGAKVLEADTPYEECLERAKENAAYLMSGYIASKQPNWYEYELMEYRLDFTDISSQTALLPVYIVECASEGKRYSFMVNGQTGEVAGPRPISRVKRTAAFMLLFALLMLSCQETWGPTVTSFEEKLVVSIIALVPCILVAWLLYAIIFKSMSARRRINADLLPRSGYQLSVKNQAKTELKCETVSVFRDPSTGNVIYNILAFVFIILGKILLIALRIALEAALSAAINSDSDSGRRTGGGRSSGTHPGGHSSGGFGGAHPGGGHSSGSGAGRRR